MTKRSGWQKTSRMQNDSWPGMRDLPLEGMIPLG